MSTIHVYLSSFLDDRHKRRTGLSRFELGVAREMAKARAGLIAYSRLRRRFVTLELDRHIRPIVSGQDTDLVGGAGRVAASLARNAGPRGVGSLLRAMLPSPAAKIEQGDTILVPGIIWTGSALAELRRLNATGRVRIVPYMHDLIPIRRPELHTDDTGVFRFRRFAETMADISDRICVSSEFVADDVRAWLAGKGKAHVPVITVPLCPDITRKTSRHRTPRLDALGIEADGYALYVSTINVRKNHAGLYAIWRHLATTTPESTLPLVIAGQRGWGVDDLLRQMSNDRAVWGHAIRLVEGPTDTEVAYLYANCAFTVYPSHYEGWGMGVTESLEFGKPCIASDRTGLIEAGQSLVIHIDPLDGRGWVNAIRRLSEDHAYRRELAARIQRDYKPRNWTDVGRDMLRALATTTDVQLATSHPERRRSEPGARG